MSEQLQDLDRKRTLRAFLRNQYSDSKLYQLYEHARAGKLRYNSCCCFIGVLTATHELQEDVLPAWDAVHCLRARQIPGARAAELAYLHLGLNDAMRRRILIPMLRAEMRRRVRGTVDSAQPAAREVLA